MKTYSITFSTFIPVSQEDIFDFFSRAENLSILSPPHLQFNILTPQPIIMKPGTIIDYRLNIYRIPVHWKTEISVWEPPNRFVDIQLKGPYKKWIHEHQFESYNNGTIIRDNIEYALYGRILAPVLNYLFVRRDIQKIFGFRENKLQTIFSEHFNSNL
ncbi:MAG: SRPBCC family protein [Calditrichaeota bacterium]|nr:SRPBCC family protein [Calditrichota bacterium]